MKAELEALKKKHEMFLERTLDLEESLALARKRASELNFIAVLQEYVIIKVP